MVLTAGRTGGSPQGDPLACYLCRLVVDCLLINHEIWGQRGLDASNGDLLVHDTARAPLLAAGKPGIQGLKSDMVLCHACNCNQNTNAINRNGQYIQQSTFHVKVQSPSDDRAAVEDARVAVTFDRRHGRSRLRRGTEPPRHWQTRLRVHSLPEGAALIGILRVGEGLWRSQSCMTATLRDCC